MPDPLEGLAVDGTIRTGAHRDRIPPAFRPLLDRCIGEVRAAEPRASVYVYGSVANGTARTPASDLDVLTIGLDGAAARRIAGELSSAFSGLCRGVEVAVAAEADFTGDGDEAYGARAFLHHYRVHLAGPDVDDSASAYPGDRRAARGFNGDIDRHLARWQAAVDSADPASSDGVPRASRCWPSPAS